MKFILLALFSLLFWSCVPCRFRNEESIEKNLVKKTPVGSTKADVRSELLRFTPNHYATWVKRESYRHHSIQSPANVIGPIYICSYMMGIMVISGYEATWTFDEGLLKEVKVNRFADGP